MGLIHLLDSDTINQIAAGEVIERPSSICKELVENAIDAKATSITVEIKGGGVNFLRVTDDGKGIAKEDIRLAFLRHATSKIQSAEDLSSVLSLGFRGEALSSIAAVSHVELITKRKEDFLGSRYVINGGEEEELSEIGCPDGTSFLIRDVFYNVPARKKFLKSAQTEGGYIAELMGRLAVANPEISFSFINQGKTVLYTSGNGQLKDAIYSVYGRDVSSNLIPMDFHGEDFSLTGYIGKPIIARGNRNYENIFINGRYVRSNLISKAIEEAYKPYFMLHKFPFTCLHFHFPSDSVDVNVHPTKMEVRINNSDVIYQAVVNAVTNAIHDQVLIQETILTEPKKEERSNVRVPEIFEPNRRRNMLDEATVIDSSIIEQPKQSEVGTTPSVTEPTQYVDTMDGGKSAAHTDLFDVWSTPKAVSVNASKGLDLSPVLNPIQEMLPEELLSIKESDETKKAFMQSNPVHREYTILGQLFKTFWLVEMANELFLIDQHAAHEKILYERTVAKYKTKQVDSQLVSPSLVLSLSVREEEVLLQNMNDFTALGFEIEHFGGREYRVNAVPTDLYMLSYENLFIDMLDNMLERPKLGPSSLVLERIATMSCKAAIKGNTKISREEAEHLIGELMTLENPYHCPHGRPVIISMSKYEIEKKFKRIV